MLPVVLQTRSTYGILPRRGRRSRGISERVPEPTALSLGRGPGSGPMTHERHLPTLAGSLQGDSVCNCFVLFWARFLLEQLLYFKLLFIYCLKFLIIKTLPWGLRVPSVYCYLIKLLQEVSVIRSNTIDIHCLWLSCQFKYEVIFNPQICLLYWSDFFLNLLRLVLASVFSRLVGFLLDFWLFRCLLYSYLNPTWGFCSSGFKYRNSHREQSRDILTITVCCS